ncbi:hypothetical protein KCU69_g27, partial [Aureobasidium melanogenum]
MPTNWVRTIKSLEERQHSHSFVLVVKHSFRYIGLVITIDGKQRSFNLVFASSKGKFAFSNCDDSLVGINEIGVIDPCDVLSIHDEMNRSQIGVRPFPPRRTLLGLFERQREMLRRIPYNHSSRGCRGSTIRGGIRYARGTCERIRDRVTRPQHRYRYEQVFCSSSRCPHDSGGIDGHLLKTRRSVAGIGWEQRLAGELHIFFTADDAVASDG